MASFYLCQGTFLSQFGPMHIIATYWLLEASNCEDGIKYGDLILIPILPAEPFLWVSNWLRHFEVCQPSVSPDFLKDKVQMPLLMIKGPLACEGMALPLLTRSSGPSACTFSRTCLCSLCCDFIGALLSSLSLFGELLVMLQDPAEGKVSLSTQGRISHTILQVSVVFTMSLCSTTYTLYFNCVIVYTYRLWVP